jgi:hypothetical protein
MDGNHGASLACVLGALLGVACSAPSQRETGGLFWAGVADGGPWLIDLRPGSDSSTAYQPPNVLAVCDLRVLGGGEVSFRTASREDGTAFRFVGHWSGSGLTGSMRQVRTQPGMMVDTLPLDLRRIAAALSSDTQSISGDYAETGTGERGGDFAGAELVLVDTPDGLVGILVDDDGGPADIRAVTGDRDGDVLRLALQSPTRLEIDTARIRGDSLFLQGGRLRLVKRLTLPALLHGPDRKECDEGLR